MSSQSEDLSTEEKKVLDEALSNGGVPIGPTAEYAADLRRRLLNAAAAVSLSPAKPNRRVLVGSIFGAAVAAVVLAGIWFSNGEPAWASAIRRARGQAWILAKVERDGVPQGEIWVSPERDIVAAKIGKTVLFEDYKHEIFLRYDGDRKPLFRASQPENPNLGQDLMSASGLAAMFRRSPGGPSLLPNEPIEHWTLRSRMIDGIPCDEYEIEIHSPDRAPSTLLLTVDKRLSLPHSLTIVEGDSHATSQFDYPSTGPLDVQALGVPVDVQTVNIDQSGKLLPIVHKLGEGRKEFDDYTALSVTSVFDGARPLQKCEVKRVLRRGVKWRIDSVDVSDPNFVLPKDPGQALSAWHAKSKVLRFAPLVICDGRWIRSFQQNGELATGGRPFQVFKATDDSVAESFATYIPERSCRPIFSTNHLFDVSSEREGSPEESIKVDVLPVPTAKGQHDPLKTYWLDPTLGDVARRIVTHLDGLSEASAGEPRSKSREVALKDFRQSPRGYWYPGIVDRDPISKSQPVTRFYVDFSSVPSDDLFGPVVPTP
ncbi:MAG TPA: hypothetical protein VGP76_28380 [Planctomycetaceae bacterium]|jgi:hypothetical protein|nr:hypothetical protein [Planctomycetaceae bacterium]